MSRSNVIENITAMTLLFALGIIAKLYWDDGTPRATVIGILGGYLRSQTEGK